MDTSFAALIYREADLGEHALVQGFAVAVAGFDVPAPHLLLAPLHGLPAWSVAFYRSGARTLAPDDEFEHVCELFEDELPPAACVLDALPHGSASVVYAVVYVESFIHDDVWRFGPDSVERRFVREGDDGLEAGFETADASELRSIDVDVRPNATEKEEYDVFERLVRPHRGTTFLASELGGPVLASLVGALFVADRRLDVRLADPAPAAISEYVRALNRVLGRSDGRAAFGSPERLGRVATSAAFAAFIAAYDWADPADPQDLYRELAIGRIVGTLRFLRERELVPHAEAPAFARAASVDLHPLATLRISGIERVIALGTDGQKLAIVEPNGRIEAAGPTFSELLRYLGLGWASRTPAEEDLIGALMLKARVRIDTEEQRP
jgi:hypothetical protein